MYLIYFGNLHALPLSPHPHPHWFFSLPFLVIFPPALMSAAPLVTSELTKVAFVSLGAALLPGAWALTDIWGPEKKSYPLHQPFMASRRSLGILSHSSLHHGVLREPTVWTWTVITTAVSPRGQHLHCAWKTVSHHSPLLKLLPLSAVAWAMEGGGVLFIPKLSPVAMGSLWSVIRLCCNSCSLYQLLLWLRLIPDVCLIFWVHMAGRWSPNPAAAQFWSFR